MHLLKGNNITSLEAIEKFGITRLSGRIYDLKERGHMIEKRTVDVRNRHGKLCKVASYFIPVGQLTLL